MHVCASEPEKCAQGSGEDSKNVASPMQRRVPTRLARALYTTRSLGTLWRTGARTSKSAIARGRFCDGREGAKPRRRWNRNDRAALCFTNVTNRTRLPCRARGCRCGVGGRWKGTLPSMSSRRRGPRRSSTSLPTTKQVVSPSGQRSRRSGTLRVPRQRRRARRSRQVSPTTSHRPAARSRGRHYIRTTIPTGGPSDGSWVTWLSRRARLGCRVVV